MECDICEFTCSPFNNGESPFNNIFKLCLKMQPVDYIRKQSQLLKVDNQKGNFFFFKQATSQFGCCLLKGLTCMLVVEPLTFLHPMIGLYGTFIFDMNIHHQALALFDAFKPYYTRDVYRTLLGFPAVQYSSHLTTMDRSPRLSEKHLTYLHGFIKWTNMSSSPGMPNGLDITPVSLKLPPYYWVILIFITRH